MGARPVAWTHSPDLHRSRRTADLDAARESVSDVLVVGGGVTGAGIALDAAARGLSVTLVEGRDLAYGTSRWSSKLVHGGLRYLAHADFAVAWESARERHHLMTAIAPHLTRALPHVLVHPHDQARTRDALVRGGLAGADVLRRLAGTSRHVLPGARSLSNDMVARLAPRIDTHRIRGAVGYWDGQLVDDARLVASIARTAAAYGARVLTRVRAIDIGPDEVLVHDTLGGDSHHLRARRVVLAVGIWSGDWAHDLPMRLSRGTHVLVRPEALGNPRAAVTVPVAVGKSRYVFALPQPQGPVIAGLTDVPADNASPDDTSPPEAEIAWVLDQLSTVLQSPLTAADTVGAYCGYRPLVSSSGRAADSENTADISRRHLIHHRPDGVVIVTGGKLTTYRRMAAETVDALRITPIPSPTKTLPLVGAGTVNAESDPQFTRRYGSEASRIHQLVRDLDLPEADLDDQGWRPADVAHAIRHEGALTVDDIVQRRIRLSVQPDRAAATRLVIAEVARTIDPDIVDEPDITDQPGKTDHRVDR